jgi:two-component system cell cycle sensor histidine kinase/response regulator CckA
MTGALRVLLVEDSPTDAKLVLQELRRTWRPVEFVRVDTAQAMSAALDQGDWDVVISDWSMPKFSAPAALAIVRDNRLDLPFIIVSGTIGEEAAVMAMRTGAHDYVLKEKLGRLAPAVEREVREQRMREAHRRSEGALRASEARFSRLTQSGIIGIMVGDPSGTIIEANDAFLRMVAFPREDMLAGNLRLRDLATPESQATTDRGVQELIARGVSTPYETEYVRKGRSRVPVLVGTALLGESQSIGFMVDLTVQKRAEEALRKTEEQLRQAQKMEAVGRLAGGIAHDFNNVLSVILSYAEILLADMKLDDAIRADVDEIQRAGVRAAALTRQLLMFSRQQVLKPRVVDLNDVLIGMDKMLQRLLGADVDLVSLPARPLGAVRVDPSSMEQVIMNLVVNARDAMPTGGRLTMETANVVLDEGYARAHLGAKPGPHVMLAVTDTGIGMDRATVARIFEPFFTTKEMGKGTGLGLSTVLGIVQQSGGSIWVYSELGKGTTFKVYLPHADAAIDATRATQPPASLRGSETILLAEDDDQVRAIAKNILRKSGYHVIDARSPGEALLHSESYHGTIHLLLSDVVMTQMSGPELAKRLSSSRPDMKVLCMSGYTDDSIIRHGVLDARIAYLQKPLTPDALA